MGNPYVYADVDKKYLYVIKVKFLPRCKYRLVKLQNIAHEILMRRYNIMEDPPPLNFRIILLINASKVFLNYLNHHVTFWSHDIPSTQAWIIVFSTTLQTRHRFSQILQQKLWITWSVNNKPFAQKLSVLNLWGPFFFTSWRDT